MRISPSLGPCSAKRREHLPPGPLRDRLPPLQIPPLRRPHNTHLARAEPSLTLQALPVQEEMELCVGCVEVEFGGGEEARAGEDGEGGPVFERPVWRSTAVRGGGVSGEGGRKGRGGKRERRDGQVQCLEVGVRVVEGLGIGRVEGRLEWRAAGAGEAGGGGGKRGQQWSARWGWGPLGRAGGARGLAPTASRTAPSDGPTASTRRNAEGNAPRHAVDEAVPQEDVCDPEVHRRVGDGGRREPLARDVLEVGGQVGREGARLVGVGC